MAKRPNLIWTDAEIERAKEMFAPSAMAVIDPGAEDIGRCHIFHDPAQGLKFLNALRNSRIYPLKEV